MKKTVLFTMALMLIAVSFVSAAGSKEKYAPAEATKYYVAHQGGYIGEATVKIDAMGAVVDAFFSEWQGPGGWAEKVNGAVPDGAVVRVPDPLANTTSTDPQVRGHMFYIYNVQGDGRTYIWSQATVTPTGFTRPTRQWERDFEGLMSNPIRAEAYARAAREDKLVNVTMVDGRIVVGKPASQTVHYGHMDKANPASVYMPVAAASIGFRYNYKATINFFKANPTANFANFTMREMKVELKEDKTVDAAGNVAAYTAATDRVFVVADAVTGATYSDFHHYSLELQQAYYNALALQRLAAIKVKK